MNDSDFWNKHRLFIENNKKGFGLWIWKPYIINKLLKIIDNNDILLYLDCGCELNIGGKELLLQHIKNVSKKKYLGSTSYRYEYIWTKIDILKYFNTLNDQNITHTYQLQSGIILISKCECTTNIMQEWYDVVINNHNLLDDTNNGDNIEGFIENRHDQSIFSIIIKKNNMYNIDLEPTWWDSKIMKDKRNISKYPIWVLRNISGASKIK